MSTIMETKIREKAIALAKTIRNEGYEARIRHNRGHGQVQETWTVTRGNLK